MYPRSVDYGRSDPCVGEPRTRGLCGGGHNFSVVEAVRGFYGSGSGGDDTRYEMENMVENLWDLWSLRSLLYLQTFTQSFIVYSRRDARRARSTK